MHIADDENCVLAGAYRGIAVRRLRAERHDRPLSQAGRVPGGQLRGMSGDAEYPACPTHRASLGITQPVEELRADLPDIERRMEGKFGKRSLIQQRVHDSIEPSSGARF